MKELWQVMVPVQDNDKQPFPDELRQRWEQKVQKIAGGLTELAQAKGQWVDSGTVYAEPMIPFQIAATEDEITEIVELTRCMFNQLAVMSYRVSDDVRITTGETPVCRHAGMRQLVEEQPQTVREFREWVKRAAAEIEPQIAASTKGKFDRRLQSLIAGIVRCAKAHAFRLGMIDLADKLPEREYKTCIDGMLRLRECLRWRAPQKKPAKSDRQSVLFA